MKSSHIVIVVAVLAVAGLVAYDMSREPDTLGEAVENVGESLDPNETPAERLGDAVEDAGDDFEDSMSE